MARHLFRLENTYTNLPGIFYTHLKPMPVSNPLLIIYNQSLADELGIDLSSLSESDMAALFSGNMMPDNATPFAQAYAGHQFGHFTMLGDGRAVVLGEHVTAAGSRVDIQFKGSGQTPYSRSGDGRAALEPMLREYILSEAMHAMGIPTTRSLAVVSTGDHVQRETMLPGAILTRIASSHVRVGTFEYAASQRNHDILQALLDYTINRHYPWLAKSENPAAALLEGVMLKQIELVTHWMRVGFIHGVMNTDNMAISGETIDYGPCAFMDSYDPKTVFSSIDSAGRYAYSSQPLITQWNLTRLAETLLPLMHKDISIAISIAEEIINRFPDLYDKSWIDMMRKKLGLVDAQNGDEKLIQTLLTWMHENHADYTNTFFELGKMELPTGEKFQNRTFKDWHASWQARLSSSPVTTDEAKQCMQCVNPVIIPRNHQVTHALKAASHSDYEPLQHLVCILSDPYIMTTDKIAYQAPPKPHERVYQTFCGT